MVNVEPIHTNFCTDSELLNVFYGTCLLLHRWACAMSLRPTKLPEKHTIVNLCTTHASDDSVNIAVKGDDQTIDLFLPNCTFWRMLCRGSGLCPVVLSVVTVPRWSPLLYVRLSFSPKKTPSPPKPSSETLFRHSSALVPQTPTPLPRNRGHYQTKLIYSG